MVGLQQKLLAKLGRLMTKYEEMSGYEVDFEIFFTKDKQTSSFQWPSILRESKNDNEENKDSSD